MYVVGCVIGPHSEYEELRARFGTGPRFHFRNESEERRQTMLGQIAECGLATSGYVAQPVPSRRQPRARSLCLKALLWDLNGWGVSELIIESRQRHNDRRDGILIVSAQRSGIAARDLRYGWETPSGNPMLWVADAVAGVVAANAHSGLYGDFLLERSTAVRAVAL